MKKISILFLGSAWVLLAIFILSSYFFNKYSNDNNQPAFMPIAWEDQKQFFKGAIQCSLTSEALLERKQQLKEKVFSKVIKKEQTQNGYIFYFNNDAKILEETLEFVLKEKACCPFFKFDISILPYNYGFAFQISGAEEALEMLEDFENNSF